MKQTFFLLLMAAITFSACTKKGDTGPQGPPGTNGTNGTNGINGNADVHAYIVYIPSSNWTNVGGGFYYSDISATAVTSDIVNSGVVIMFLQGNTGVWLAIPYTDVPDGVSYGFNYALGGIRVFAMSTSGGALSFPSIVTYKVVIIPASQKQAHPGTDWTNYDQVMQVVNDTRPAAAQ